MKTQLLDRCTTTTTSSTPIVFVRRKLAGICFGVNDAHLLALS